MWFSSGFSLNFQITAMRNFVILLGAVLLIGSIDVTSSFRLRRLSRANGIFAVNLYSKLIDGEDGKNVFFSPFRYDYLISP